MRHPPPFPNASDDLPCGAAGSPSADVRPEPRGGPSPVVLARRAAAAPVQRVEVRHAGEDGRAELEAYVADVYAEAYGARLRHFLPLLVGLRDDEGRLAGVIGARPARAAGPLFLEAYLDVPAEEALAARLGVAIPRWALVEVGNLASDRSGGGRLLLGALAHLLDGLGTPMAVFTATQPLRSTFRRLGVAPLMLAPADGRRLGRGLDEWGSYYDTDPQVCSVPVALVRDAVRRDPGLAREMAPLWQHARRAGRALLADEAA